MNNLCKSTQWAKRTSLSNALGDARLKRIAHPERCAKGDLSKTSLPTQAEPSCHLANTAFAAKHVRAFVSPCIYSLRGKACVNILKSFINPSRLRHQDAPAIIELKCRSPKRPSLRGTLRNSAPDGRVFVTILETSISKSSKLKSERRLGRLWSH